MPRWFLLAMMLALAPTALAQRQVETEQLRLGFDAAGNLQSAFACFPACVGDGVRLQQFGDAGVVELGGSDDAGWRLERTYPSPLFESLHGEERFQQLMDRIDADIERMNARIEQEGLALPLPSEN